MFKFAQCTTRHGDGTDQLSPELYLHLDGEYVEVWVQRSGMYAELLADSELQEVGDRNLLKGRKGKAPARPGLFVWARARRVLALAGLLKAEE